MTEIREKRMSWKEGRGEESKGVRPKATCQSATKYSLGHLQFSKACELEPKAAVTCFRISALRCCTAEVNV